MDTALLGTQRKGAGMAERSDEQGVTSWREQWSLNSGELELARRKNSSKSTGEKKSVEAGICSWHGRVVTSWVVLVHKSWGVQVRVEGEANKLQEAKELRHNHIGLFFIAPMIKEPRAPAHPVSSLSTRSSVGVDKYIKNANTCFHTRPPWIVLFSKLC